MLSGEQVDRVADDIVATVREDNGQDLWERVRAILRQWTGA